MGKPLDRAKSPSKILIIAFTILTQCWMLSAGEKSALSLEGFRIGSDFRKFKSKYKKLVKCNQTLFPLTQTSNKKETWNRTVNCSSGKGVPVDSRLFYGNLEKSTAPDLNAVFESKKLTMLEFIFDSSQFEQLKSFFTAQNGPPTWQQSDDSNDVVFAGWTSKDSKIEIQLIPLMSRVVSGGFLHFDSGSSRVGVRVRLSTLSASEDD